MKYVGTSSGIGLERIKSERTSARLGVFKIDMFELLCVLILIKFGLCWYILLTELIKLAEKTWLNEIELKRFQKPLSEIELWPNRTSRKMRVNLWNYVGNQWRGGKTTFTWKFVSTSRTKNSERLRYVCTTVVVEGFGQIRYAETFSITKLRWNSSIFPTLTNTFKSQGIILLVGLRDGAEDTLSSARGCLIFPDYLRIGGFNSLELTPMAGFGRSSRFFLLKKRNGHTIPGRCVEFPPRVIQSGEPLLVRGSRIAGSMASACCVSWRLQL